MHYAENPESDPNHPHHHTGEAFDPAQSGAFDSDPSRMDIAAHMGIKQQPRPSS
jgi:hypothetical protein